MKGLDDLPTLMELRDIDTINAELELSMPGEVAEVPEQQAEQAPGEAGSPAEEAPRVVQVPLDTPESNETIH
jgi:hypothetical protein